MENFRPSSVDLSKDYTFDSEFRTMLMQLWGNLPKYMRESWEDHPKRIENGAMFAFWWENYNRWRGYWEWPYGHGRRKQGILFEWPEEWTGQAISVTSGSALTRGDAIDIEIGIDRPGPVSLIAISFSKQYRYGAYERGLKALLITTGGKVIKQTFLGQPSGVRHGLATVFSKSGVITQVFSLPTVFCN